MWRHVPSRNAVRNCRQDALSAREFELLYEAAAKLGSTSPVANACRSIEGQLAVILSGRLGLRVGEIVHFREDWVNWESNRIAIPAHVECHKGKDGGICGLCTQYVAMVVEYHDDVSCPDVAPDWWRPKSENSVRTVPFGWVPRAQLVLSRFFGDQHGYDQYPKSAMTLYRHIKTAAELADGLDPETIYPHALRATAASHLSNRGLAAKDLKDMMGWQLISTAERYISSTPESTQDALRRIHGQ